MTATGALPQHAAVVIIGGGMAGLSCAASLARRGIQDVVLLEAKTLAHAKARPAHGSCVLGAKAAREFHII